MVLGPHLTRIVLAGDIDEVLSPQLLAAQRTAIEAGSRVEVDVTEVTFMNSAGASFLGVLAARSPTPMALVRPSAEVCFLLELTHTAALMEIVDRPDPAPQRHLRMVRSVMTEPGGE